MLARIFRPAKSAMQSGHATSQLWVLEFEPASAKTSDPLMGWTQTSDTRGQVRLQFETSEQAVAYAQRCGIPFELQPEPRKTRNVRAYADNFAFTRKIPWSH